MKPRLRGNHPVRYCDDFIIGFEREEDARRVRAVLEKRLGALTDPAPGQDPAVALLASANDATVVKVRPPLTLWGLRSIGGGPAQGTGGWGARRGGRA